MDQTREGRPVEATLESRPIPEGDPLFRSLFQNAPVGVAVLSPDGLFLCVNPVFEAMLGYTDQELRGRSALDITAEADRASTSEAYRILLSGASDIWVVDKRYRKENGDLLWAQATAVLVRDSEGLPWYFIGLIEDITQRKGSEHALICARNRLQALSRRLVHVQETQLRQLARELHDRVGQNLTALSLNLDAARMAVKEGRCDLAAELLHDSSVVLEHTGSAIHDVLAELRPPMLEEFGLLAALQWFASHHLRLSGIRTVVEMAGKSPPRNHCVELALFRVAQEALNNIGRHSKAKAVSIRLRGTDSGLELFIHDNGIGFDTGAVASRHPCFGLATMRERCESIGARLQIDSRPRYGTSITVTAPHGA